MNDGFTSRQASTAYRGASQSLPLPRVVMLYDRVLSALRASVSAIEQKRPEEAFNNLNVAVTILCELRQSLDFNKGGALAERISETYVRLVMSALHSFAKPDAVVRYNKLIVAVSRLRDAWSDALGA